MTQEKRIIRGWMNLRVAKIIDETWDTKTFLFVNDEQGTRAFDYEAGQYLTFRFDGISEKPIVRSYTMSSSPCQADMIAVTIKRVEGGFISNWLCDHVKEGQVLRARGPIGAFRFIESEQHQRLTMVAGGSGVTPFISIVRELLFQRMQQKSNTLPQDITLIVSYRSDKDLICEKELDDFKKRGVNIIVTLSRQDLTPQYEYGRVSEQLLKKYIDTSFSKTLYMTCGPDPLMDQVKNFLLANKVAEADIKTESFA